MALLKAILSSAFGRPDRLSAELAYLNQATSRVDLEMRLREIDRGRFKHLPQVR